MLLVEVDTSQQSSMFNVIVCYERQPYMSILP